jgi:hypothetical protein
MHSFSTPLARSSLPGNADVPAFHGKDGGIDLAWVEREVAKAPVFTSDAAALFSRLLWPDGSHHFVLIDALSRGGASQDQTVASSGHPLLAEVAS